MKDFVINKAYAQNALDNRSMFLRHYYVLLLYFALTPRHALPEELKPYYAALGQARILDLSLRLSIYTAKRSWNHTWNNLQNAWADRSRPWLFPFSLLYRLVCVPLSALSIVIMFPVNFIYGILDWVSLRMAKAYVTYGTAQTQTLIDRASKIALSTSILTIPVRLAVGLVEAIQEPLHLYDFWVKGGKDAYQEYHRGEISKTVFGAKILLHTFKVVCTLGAVMSIVGLAVGPVLKSLSQTAHWLIHTKDALPNAHLLEMPVNALKYTMIGAEHAVAETVGVHYSYMSLRTNTNRAIELGFESCLTRGTLPVLTPNEGYQAKDFNRPDPL